MVTDPSSRIDLHSPFWMRLLDDVPVCTALLSTDEFVYEYANAPMRALAPGKTVVGQTYQEVWTQAASVTEPLLRSVADTGEPWHGENVGWWLSHEADGPLEYRFFDFILQRVTYDGSHHLLLTARETTAVVARQEAARGAGVRLEEVLESITDAFFTLDFEWRFTYLNSNAAHLLDRSRDELLGGNVWELFPEAVSSIFQSEYRQVMDLRVKRAFEAYYEPLDLMLEVRAYPVLDGIAIFFTEIRDRVLAQQRLAESEELFRSVFDSAAIGIGQVTREGRFVRVNETYAAMLKYTPEELAQKSFQDVTHPEDLQSDLALAEEVAAGRLDRYTLEKRYVAKDGSIVPTVLTVSGVSDDEGHLRYFIALVEDMRGRREVESRALLELERTRLLKDVAAAAASSLGIRDVCMRVLEALRRSLGAHVGSVFYLDRESNVLKHLARFGYPPEVEPDLESLPVDEDSVLGYALVNRLPYVTHEIAPLPAGTARRTEVVGVASDRWIALPLRAKDEDLGGLVLTFPVQRSFTEEEISLYRAVADLLAVALENAQLFEAQVRAGRAAKRELELASLLVESAQALGASLRLDDVLNRLAELSLSFLSHDRVTIHLYDARRNELSIAASRGREAAEVRGSIPLATASARMIEALASRQPQVIDYEAMASAERGRALEMGTRLALVVPLVTAGDLVGVVIVDDPNERRSFDEREIELVGAVASQAAVAIKNAQLYDELSERVRLGELRAEIDNLTHSTLDTDEVMRRTVSAATRGLDAEGGAIELLVEGSWEVRYASSPDIPTGRPLTGAAVIAGLVAEALHPIAIEDAWNDPSLDAGMMEENEVRAVFAIPLIVRSRLVGVMLFFERARARRYSSAETDFVQKLGASVSLALENARLYEQARERVRLGEALATIDEAVHSSLDVDEAVKGALADGARALGADSAAIDGVESDGWVVWYDHGFEPTIVGRQYTNEQNPHGVLALNSGETVAVNDVSADTRVHVETLEAYGLRSVIVAPLVVRGRAIAALYYNYRERAHRFTRGEIEFVTNVASSLSLAIENARLFEQERRVGRLNDALSRVNQLLLSTLSPDELLGSVVEEASRVAGAARGVVVEIDGDDFVFTHTYGYPQALKQARVPRDEAPVIDLAVRTQQPQLVEDVGTEARINKDLYEPYGIQSFMALPLVVQGGVLGALVFQYASAQQFDEGSIVFAQRMSSALSLALENARRFQAERTIAETLQDTLVVLPQHIAGIEFARFYQSASDTGRVGGDFIDVFEIRDGKIAVTLGDVSGKGLKAASLTATVRNTIRAHAIEGLPPATVISHTNDIARRFSTPETFVTLLYAVIDTRSGVIRYVNAGHPPGVVLRDGRVQDHLGPGNSIIGAFEHVGFVEGRAKVGAGDCLVLFSDGVTEARRDGVLFGEDRVAEALADCREASPEQVVEALHDAVLDWAHGELHDDVAILAVQRTYKKVRESAEGVGPIV